MDCCQRFELIVTEPCKQVCQRNSEFGRTKVPSGVVLELTRLVSNLQGAASNLYPSFLRGDRLGILIPCDMVVWAKWVLLVTAEQVEALRVLEKIRGLLGC